MSTDTAVFILAGGAGERFWPLSRSATPKHLLRLFSEQTLLEETVRRFSGLTDPERIFVLTQADLVESCRKVTEELLSPGQIIGEPARRDTAPAAALATALARNVDARSVALFPADARIANVDTFRHQFLEALEVLSEAGGFLTFGVPPTGPSTAFGYLKLGETLNREGTDSVVRRVERFVEKPDADTARSYLAEGGYTWNAGMFFWSPETFLSETQRLAPELARFVTDFPRGDFQEFLEKRFPVLPRISIDYAVMEQARPMVSMEARFDWDDVGSWTALPTHLGSDADGNTLRGSTLSHRSEKNIVLSTGRTVALCGVRDLVVVETGDAVLVCHRDAVQEVKNLPLPDHLQ